MGYFLTITFGAPQRKQYIDSPHILARYDRFSQFQHLINCASHPCLAAEVKGTDVPAAVGAPAPLAVNRLRFVAPLLPTIVGAENSVSPDQSLRWDRRG